MSDNRALVVGASGFLGSHVTRRLAASGRPVRILVRPSSNTAATDDLALERCRGDVLDPASLAGVYDGCDTVFHCVVDTRAWARDPTALYRVNIDGLVHSMTAALAAGVRRFILTSTIATIGRNPSGRSRESDLLTGVERLPHYIRARFQAEQTFFRWVEERGLPGIACCVANTYGPGDLAPTPHGRIIAAAAAGAMPAYIDGMTAAVGVEDAAEALILAEARGRVGERYIISERGLSQGELMRIAAEAGGTSVRPRRMPLALAYGIAWLAQTAARLRGHDSQLCVDSVRLSHIIDDMESTKAREELGWQPRPVEEAIRAAIRFYAERAAAG
jgi:dihydroflavonol-4-reductase